jgi:hypothetical protein
MYQWVNLFIISIKNSKHTTSTDTSSVPAPITYDQYETISHPLFTEVLNNNVYSVLQNLNYYVLTSAHPHVRKNEKNIQRPKKLQ